MDTDGASKPRVRRKDLIEPELSYTIVGACIEVFHEIGPGLKELTYQRAVAKAFIGRGLQFREQVHCPVQFSGEKVGHLYLDFLVSEKVILELKRGDYYPRTHIQQVKEYLVATGLQLGIIATFTSSGVQFRRIVNTHSNNQHS